MLKNKRFCFIITFLICIILLANIGLYSKPSAMQGRHFIVGFMQNEIYRTDLHQTYYMSIFVSTLKTDTVIVNIPNERDKIYSLSAGQIQEIQIPTHCEVNTVGTNKSKLIDIRSKSQMIVWVYSSKNQSSDSYVVMPVSIWGNEYRIASIGNDMYNGKQRLIADECIDNLGNILDQTKYQEHITPRSSEFLVMASLDNTIIEYVPTCDTKNGTLKEQTATTILNAGECLLVQGAVGDMSSNDLTGTLVSSNNPIGIVSGHVRSAVMQGLDNPYDTKDHLIEMLPPVKAWGKFFISVPFINGENVSTNNYKNLCKSGDLIKVIATEDNTKVNYSIQVDEKLENNVSIIKKAGDYFEIEASTPIIWNSDKPIMITQFMMHKGLDDESLFYDPAFVVLTPIEQYVEETTFSTPSNNKIFDQYVAHAFIAISDSIGIYNLKFENANLDENSTNVWCKQIGDSKYFWLMKVVKNGTHKIVATQGKFSGIIYGHGFRDSYAMTLGSRLNDPFNIDTIPPLVEIDSTCGTIKIKVSDITKNDTNATGIDWGTIGNNIINYNISEFHISDTSTIVDIVATPIDTTKDGYFDIEFIDKNYNIVKKYFNYTGFNVERPSQYNFNMLKWNSPTEATFDIKNIGNGTINLINIEQPTDNRIKASVQKKLPFNIVKNETLEVKVVFTPDASLNPVNTKVVLEFDCHKIEISLIGKISAPGLLADDLDFGKVRLYDTKTLSGKIHNAGNISLIVNEINKDVEEKSFEWNWNKTLPNNMAIDDSINYIVKFTPTEEQNYIVNSIVKNDNDINCNFYVKGTSGKPNIENIEINWEKRRIGTKNDTSIFIVNSGSFTDTINYKSNISLSHNLDLSVDSIKKIQNIIINEKDSINKKFSFIPIDTIPLENKFELVSKWNYHTPIIATFKAQGTIPKYESFNYDFGNVPILSNINYSHNCVFSFGNEALTIDSIILIGGNTNSFTINYNQLYNLIIEPNEYLKLPITFSPTFKGQHKIYLEITHDANPNYLRSKDTIEIYGNCITENIDLIADLDIPILFSCVTNEALLNIENIGEANIIIDSIKLDYQQNIFTADFINNPTYIFPTDLQHNEKISFPIKIYAERDEIGFLNIEIFYNNENKIVISKKIEPQTSTITSTLTIPTNSMVLPGDTIHLICQSKIVEKSEKDFKYKINLDVNKKMLYCLEKKCYININNNGKNYQYVIDIEQYIDKIEFIFPTEFFEIEGNATIQFELPFVVLLALEKESTINYNLISDRCYYSEASNLDIKVSPVCGDSIRQFEFDGFPYSIVNQNPVVDEINLTLNLLEQENVSVVIYDLLGNEIYNNNYIYEKGKHNIKIKIENVANTVYFVQTKSKTINTTQKVILRN